MLLILFHEGRDRDHKHSSYLLSKTSHSAPRIITLRKITLVRHLCVLNPHSGPTASLKEKGKARMPPLRWSQPNPQKRFILTQPPLIGFWKPLEPALYDIWTSPKVSGWCWTTQHCLQVINNQVLLKTSAIGMSAACYNEQRPYFSETRPFSEKMY